MKDLQFIIIEKYTGAKSLPIPLEWFYLGDTDLEFDNEETLPLKDFIFFRDDYEIQLFNKKIL